MCCHLMSQDLRKRHSNRNSVRVPQEGLNTLQTKCDVPDSWERPSAALGRCAWPCHRPGSLPSTVRTLEMPSPVRRPCGTVVAGRWLGARRFRCARSVGGIRMISWNKRVAIARAGNRCGSAQSRRSIQVMWSAECCFSESSPACDTWSCFSRNMGPLHGRRLTATGTLTYCPKKTRPRQVAEAQWER